MPNFNRADDVMLLKNQLIKEGWSLEAIYSLLDNLGLTEDDKWWTKLSPEQQAQYIKDHPNSEKALDAKRKEKGEEPKEPVDKEEEELSVDYHDELESEHKNPMVEKQIKEAEARLEDKSNTLDSTKVTERIKSTKTNVDDVTSSIGVELRLGDKRANINKTNIVDVIFKPNRQFNFHYEVPEMQRGSSLEKLAEDLKSKGWTDIEYNSKRIIAYSPDGKKYVIHSKPDKTKSKKQIGEATAYEGVVALAYAIADSDYTEEELGTIIETLVNDRKFVTKGGVSVDTLSLRADAAEFFSNPENTEKLKEQLKAILSNPKLAVEMAAAKDLLNKGDFPEGTKLRVDCEGGADTDEFRADIVIYAETPDGEKIALIGSSVKDGSSVQLGQLGPVKAVKAIEATEPGSDERRQALIDGGYEQQIQKLPESMRDAYRERIVQLDDPEQIHQAMLDGVLDAADEDPTALYEFMTFNLVGTNPPEGLQAFLYQNAGKLSKVPLPDSEEGKEILTKIQKLYKSGRIRKSEDPKKGSFLMFVDKDGKEHPIMKTRTKKTRDGKIERTYIEKGGANSVLFKLLEGELG
jgi:hypothetical protein